VSEPSHFLARIVGALDGAGVPHMLAGSFASSIHGTPRSTQDIGLVIDPTFASLDRFLELLGTDSLYVDADVARSELRRRGQFNVIDGTTFWKADLMFRKNRPFSLSELERRVPAKVLGVDVSVATAEDTVLAKLEWAELGESERQLRDVEGILKVKGPSLDRAYVERWVDGLGVREQWDRVQLTIPREGRDGNS
jgi:hypothetical protein